MYYSQTYFYMKMFVSANSNLPLKMVFQTDTGAWNVIHTKII